jgi:hypothetical protein
MKKKFKTSNRVKLYKLLGSPLADTPEPFNTVHGALVKIATDRKLVLISNRIIYSVMNRIYGTIVGNTRITHRLKNLIVRCEIGDITIMDSEEVLLDALDAMIVLSVCSVVDICSIEDAKERTGGIIHVKIDNISQILMEMYHPDHIVKNWMINET